VSFALLALFGLAPLLTDPLRHPVSMTRPRPGLDPNSLISSPRSSAPLTLSPLPIDIVSCFVRPQLSPTQLTLYGRARATLVICGTPLVGRPYATLFMYKLGSDAVASPFLTLRLAKVALMTVSPTVLSTPSVQRPGRLWYLPFLFPETVSSLGSRWVPGGCIRSYGDLVHGVSCSHVSVL